jgi:membrane protease YdiL (CAAX protease family)
LSRLYRVAMGPDAWNSLADGMMRGGTPAGVLVNLFLFGLLILALAITLAVLHRRRLAGLIGPPALALRQFRQVTVALLMLVAVMLLLPGDAGTAPRPNMPFGRWLLLLPLGLIGLVIQTAAEEIAFRGYLQSQLAAWIRHPAIWMGLPSAIFALLHYDPVLNGANTWLVVGWAFGFGLAAADLTARSGTLGPAIALHLVNNFGAVLIAAPTGNFDGLALYVYPFSLGDEDILWHWFPIDLMMLGCSWLAARVALRC